MDESLDLSAIEESVTEPSDYQCAYCSYHTRFKQNLNRHQKVHPVCTSSTPVKPKPPEPSEKKKHMCDQCAKEFDTKYGLTLHRKNKHDKAFKHVCQICQKGYNQTVQYRFHCGNHLNVSFEKCSFCGANFTSPGSLKKHLRICKENPDHRQEATFVCAACPAAFPTKQGLNYHRRGKHQPPKYICSQCNRAFAWRSSLRAHKKSAHSEPPQVSANV